MKDLRPICILPLAAKVLEGIVFDQITQYVEEHFILHMHQSGYRRGHSTETALVGVTDEVVTALDAGKMVVLILLDMSRAFDSVDREILLAKLHYIGVRGAIWVWCKDFLSNRCQRVEICGDQGIAVSDDEETTIGVPQGSKLSTLFFNIYLVDIFEVVRHCSVDAYADDVQLRFAYASSERFLAEMKINEDLQSIHDWSMKNGLQINAAKTEAIVFGGDKAGPLNLVLNNSSIVFSDSVRNLGLIMDKKLNFSVHVSNLCRSAFLSLRSLYQVRNYLTQDCKLRLCESLVLSKLNYGDKVFGPCLRQEDARRLQKVQNSCIRFSCGVAYREHVSPIIRSIGWLSMEDRRLLHLCCLVHKVITSQTPKYLWDKIERRCDAHTVNTRNSDTFLSIPAHKSHFFERCFTYQAPLIYNKVPAHVKGLSVLSFKRCMTELLRSGDFVRI